MKIGAIVQARMNSTRLPGKVLTEVDGRPLLQFLLERIQHCSNLDEIIVATSTEELDTQIYDFCINNNYSCHRGALANVASRFYEIIKAHSFDTIVRVNGDSPLLDPQLIEQGIAHFQKRNCDLVTNTFPRSFPKGQSVEVIDAEKFCSAYLDFQDSDDFEHVTQYFYKRPEQFNIYNFSTDKTLGELQLSIDLPEDLERFQQIYKKMTLPHWQYDLDQILTIYFSLNPV